MSTPFRDIPVSFSRMTDEQSPLPLAGRTVLVSGGARRVARKSCARCTFRGECARSLSQLRSDARALVDELNARRAGPPPRRARICSNPGPPRFWSGRRCANSGGSTFLVNSASTFYPTPVGHITEAHWDDLMGSNLKAPLFLSQAAAPSLRAQSGLIINIVDIHALRPLKGYPLYSIAKAGSPC